MSDAYQVELLPEERAKVAQLARVNRLAVLINSRCEDQEIQIEVRKDKVSVDIYEVMKPFGQLERIRHFGHSGDTEFPNGGVDEAQRWLEGFAETIFRKEKT